MHLGIKVGPDNWREKLLNGLSVRHVEVYHNFSLTDDYAPLYAWLRANGVQARLHASTLLHSVYFWPTSVRQGRTLPAIFQP